MTDLFGLKKISGSSMDGVLVDGRCFTIILVTDMHSSLFELEFLELRLELQPFIV